MPSVLGKLVMLVDAREGSEVAVVAFEITEEMPARTRRVLRNNLGAEGKGKAKYENVYFHDGSEGTDGLVRESDECEESDCAALDEFFDRVFSETAMQVDPIGRRVDFLISLVEA